MKQLALVPTSDAYRCVFYNPRMRHVRSFSFSYPRNGWQPDAERANEHAEVQCKLHNYYLLTLNFERKNQ